MDYEHIEVYLHSLLKGEWVILIQNVCAGNVASYEDVTNGTGCNVIFYSTSDEYYIGGCPFILPPLFGSVSNSSTL
jgi:hypothetical protein